MRFVKSTTFATAAVAAIFYTAPVLAQVPSNLRGHVNNAAGQPLTKGEVKFTKDRGVEEKDQKFAYSFPIDSNGDYKATGVAPGEYFVYVVVDGKRPDRAEVTIKDGEDRTLDFDMSRAEYVAKMSPEEKATLEEYKKKNAEATNANAIIKGLNATLKTTRDDLAAASKTKDDVSKDVTAMKAAVDAKPDEGLLWVTYGDTLSAQADHVAATDKKEGKSPMSDEAVLKGYSDAASAFRKGADLIAASKKPNPVDQAVAYNSAGNALAKSGHLQEASAAFEQAVKLSPANAGMYYGNEAAVFFNAGKTEEAAVAADKAIAADPSKADPYFVKGQALIAKSTFDNKTQKLTPPPGCVDAYQKYLELSPDGSHAQNVREVLASLGEKINTKYTAGKKR